MSQYSPKQVFEYLSQAGTYPCNSVMAIMMWLHLAVLARRDGAWDNEVEEEDVFDRIDNGDRELRAAILTCGESLASKPQWVQDLLKTDVRGWDVDMQAYCAVGMLADQGWIERREEDLTILVAQPRFRDYFCGLMPQG